ncbi:hypothetical protein AX777_10765 [Sphingobium yanoikuyae]|jgi:hypothetical protein|uniref:Uncharacterized protein n=1 Tax=Sphingobium yanoikuyae TaxID=13690 RepID=A0A177JPZ4_SPHYA|nr:MULTISPECIES: DUF6118 family protein [Sphingobium]KZC79441.1 hypothetical protein AYR46_13610 [Sphingobium yanoikuyae]OAH43302.1 hypothetical protein AX777_10765 [Sphingobium yanoikuyae]PHP18919.1 hypothetical protein CG471_14935 [Sphingobium sp. IP1]RSU74322.1 hypothetical protein BRX37_13750 [Sphingomonas sp. S-NIH.Pt3_0716]
MDDNDDMKPNQPGREPQAGSAAEAFARLVARVAEMEERLEGRMAMMTRALEHIAVEKQSLDVPDYNPTLGRINGNIAEFAKQMKAIKESEALKMTPESMAERIMAAAEAAREADRIAIRDARELHRQAIAAMNRGVGTVRTREQQQWHILYAIGGAILAVSLLWLIYPGWAASLGPQNWHWPERVARRTMGEPTLWDAGIRMMRVGNPEGWQAIVDAAEMRQANRDAIAACEEVAAKAKEMVRCTVRVETPQS